MSKLFTFDKTINAGEKFYLKDIISDVDYKEWFSMSDNPKIFILNKGRCGNGGTSGFINYAGANHKGMFVLVPNRSIVQSKEIQYKDICCIYGGNILSYHYPSSGFTLLFQILLVNCSSLGSGFFWFFSGSF